MSSNKMKSCLVKCFLPILIAVSVLVSCSRPASPQRLAFAARLAPGSEKAYRERIAKPGAELAETLHGQGLRDLSVYGKRDLLFLCVDYDGRRAIAKTESFVARELAFLNEENSFVPLNSNRPAGWQRLEEIFMYQNPTVPPGGSNFRMAPITWLTPEYTAQYRENHAHPWPALLKNMTNQAMERFSIHQGGPYLFAYVEQRKGLPPQAPLTEAEQAKLNEWNAFALKVLRHPFPDGKGVWQGTDLVLHVP